MLLEVFGRDGVVQGWAWYHWNHDRIERTGGGACNVELARFYDGMRRVSLSVPAGSGAGDVTCRVLSVDPAAVWQVSGAAVTLQRETMGRRVGNHGMRLLPWRGNLWTLRRNGCPGVAKPCRPDSLTRILRVSLWITR